MSSITTGRRKAAAELAAQITDEDRAPVALALVQLFDHAAKMGHASETNRALFQLLDKEPHRVPRLVCSVQAGRLDDVVYALLDYGC